LRHFRTYSVTVLMALLMSSASWAGISVNPTSVAKSQVKIGTSSDQIIEIRRSGGSSTVDSVKMLMGTPEWADLLTDTLPYLLQNPPDSVAVRVRFSPTSIGTFTDTLEIYYDAANILEVPLSGTSGLGIDSVSTDTIAFDSVLATATKDDSLFVYNTGTAAMEVRLEMAGGSPLFIAVPDSFSVAAGGNQKVTVSFSPVASGDFTEDLRVMTDTKGGVVRDDTVLVALMGTGVAPAISFQPVSLDFGNVLVGVPDTLTFTISNPGTADLTIGGVAGSDAEFLTVGGPATPFTVPAGSTSATFSVQFTPVVGGVRNKTYQFSTNIPGQPTVAYSMTGFGINPDIAVSPLFYDFGEIPIQTRDTLSIDVQNVGNSDLTIISVGLQLGLTEYTIIQTIPPNTVIQPAGQPTVILVEVAPQTPNLTLSDTLVIVSDDPDEGTVKVPITGVTVEARIQLSTTAVDFGSIFAGQSVEDTVYISNDGSDTLSFTSVLGNSTDFSVAPLAGDVLAGETLMVLVTYAPAAIGADTSTWRLTTNAPANPQISVALSGAATSRLAAPVIVNFGNVPVGQSQLGQLVLRNASAVPAERVPIDNITMSPGFELVDPPAFPDTLDALEAETLTVRFSPLTAGAAAGTATIAFVEPTLSADTIGVALSGTGVASPRTIVRVINYPNPFVPEDGTTILIGLGSAATVSVNIYDLSGQLLDEPVQAQSYGAGEHEISWDGRRYDGAYVAYGVYLCEVVAIPSAGGEEDREFRKLACGRR